jgi:hypothetical protein
MGQNTYIYNRWQGYTAADCDCCYCVHYMGKNHPCPLEVCCCTEERKSALRREQVATSDTAHEGAAQWRG